MVYKGLPDFSEMMGRSGASGKQRKGKHTFSTTGGSAEHRYGSLTKNLKSYATPSKMREIYAATMFLSAIEDGEENPDAFWKTVEELRNAGLELPSNQEIWDRWIGDSYSYNQIQRMIEGMEEGSGLEAIALEVRGLRGGQTVITASGRSPEEEERRLQTLKWMLDKGIISQEQYERRAGSGSGAGYGAAKEYKRKLGRQLGPDAHAKDTIWGPDQPA